MQYKSEINRFHNSCIATLFLCVMFTGIALSVYFCLPAAIVQPVPEVLVADVISDESDDDFSEDFYDHITEASFEKINSNEDPGLTLYRQAYARGAVEKFYSCIVRNKDVALAILSEADKNDIPLALAFALALKLNIDEAKDFLGRAGYAFSPSSKTDLIVQYFIENEVYEIMTINLALCQHNEPLLG